MVRVCLHQCIVGVESVRLHHGVFRSHVVGKMNRDRRRRMARFAPSFQGHANGMGMRCAAF